ncbi:MAG: MurT ligase domain-containing protein [Thermacetogeniaceae bacterium]
MTKAILASSPDLAYDRSGVSAGIDGDKGWGEEMASVFLPRKGLLNGLRALLSIWAGKLTALACRLVGYPGTSLPGVVSLKLFPGIVEFLASSYDVVVAVTGTNGKTTTANLLAHFLREAGLSVAHNSEGANMLPGVATALIRDCDLLGRRRSRFAILEVDEGSVGRVFSAAKPRVVVVTNYFRDQLDRYWELERTTGLLRSTLDRLQDVTLILNADDPLVAAIGRGREKVRYYGVNDEDAKGGAAGGGRGAAYAETREGRYCSFCGTELVYKKIYYGQLGHYFCPGCGFSRPEPCLLASCVSEGEVLSFSVEVQERDGGMTPQGASMRFAAPMRGFYNVYNILAAASAASALGISLDAVRSSLLGYKAATGRMERFSLGGRPCTLVLIKNPAGVNQVLRTILSSDTAKSLVLAINDLAADGRDVSWLWDADFALLADARVKRIICSGLRAADMAVCLKYFGISTERLLIVPERRESLQLLQKQEGDELFVLATYTNLFAYAKLLRRMGKGGEVVAPQNLPSLS